MRETAWTAWQFCDLRIRVAVVETMLSESENVSAAFVCESLYPEKENARESPEACAK
jgi:hypothetical protein